MTVFLNNFLIALPLFALVGLGYLFASLRLVTPEIGKALSKFAFTVAIPTLLFRLMSNITQLPAPKLGVPISIALLTPASMPALAVIFALNAFLMWTFATVQTEFTAGAADPSLSKTIYQGTMRSLRNPIVIGIALGLLWSLTGLPMPSTAEENCRSDGKRRLPCRALRGWCRSYPI